MGRLLILASIALICYSLFRGNSDGEVEFPNLVISTPTPAKSVDGADRIRVILFTGTEWCPACQNLDSTVMASSAWKDFAAKEIRFRVVNIPADRSKASQSDLNLTSQYQIRGFPTMIVLDRENNELSRMVGSGPPVENFKAWIRGHETFYRS